MFGKTLVCALVLGGLLTISVGCKPEEEKKTAPQQTPPKMPATIPTTGPTTMPK